jgi:hypothetical protein
MKSSFFKLASVATLTAVLSLSNAFGLTISSPNVVGIYDGKMTDASIATEILAAQKLLDMAKDTTFGSFNASSNLYLYQTSNTEYAATLTSTNAVQSATTAVSDFDWGFAKYNGPNAGYVLFYLGGADASTIIPNYPAPIWTTNPSKYALSHVTLFNKTVPTDIPVPQVPESGATVALLGAVLAGLACLRRRSA